MNTTNHIAINDYISGGYFITKLTKRPEYMSPQLLPDLIVSASDCIVDIFPNFWAISWAGGITNEERKQQANKFGLPTKSLEELINWTTECLAKDELAYPTMFINFDDAKTFIKNFGTSIPNTVLLGIGLHKSLVSKFLADAKPPAEGIMPAVYYSINKQLKLAQGGRSIGFEVLGYDEYGSNHSWLCNDLQSDANEQFGIRPGKLGLLDTLAEATKVAEHASREEVGAEPGVWLPWLVVQYS